MNKEVLEKVIEPEMIKEIGMTMGHNQNRGLILASNSNTRYMSVNTVSVYLDVSRRTIYRYINNGLIPCFKGPSGYRFDKVEIDQWMTSYRSVSNDLPEIKEY
jgi:excisionase family DNA binding protein